MNTQPQPSIKILLLSCISALLLAALLLLTLVLPAEFNVDPTGMGHKLGLTMLAQTELGEDKAVAIETQNATINITDWQDVVVIAIPPHKGVEYKFYIQQNETLEFDWITNGVSLYFDFHGEPAGDTSGYFKSYKENTQNQSSGTLKVPFTGSHGWYWENKSTQIVLVWLKTRGHYRKLGLL